MKRTLPFFALVALLLLTLQGTTPLLSQPAFAKPPATTAQRRADETDIREALFRYLFHPPANAPFEETVYERRMRRAGTPVKPLTPPSPDPKAHPWAGSGYTVYFLEMTNSAGKDSDPDATLLKRFAGNTPPVKPASASFVDKQAKDHMMAAVTDRKTGEPGLRFFVGSIRWMSRNRVQVEAGYSAGGRNAQSSKFTLIRQKGRWLVTKISETLVS